MRSAMSALGAHQLRGSHLANFLHYAAIDVWDGRICSGRHARIIDGERVGTKIEQ